MSVFSHTFPAVPSDPLSLWKKINPNIKNGFYFGSGALSSQSHNIYFSLSEPSRIFSGSHKNAVLQLKALSKALETNPSKINIPRLVGLFSFEAGRLFDSGLARQLWPSKKMEFPLFEFADYPAVAHINLKKNLFTVYFSEAVSKKRRDEILVKIKLEFNFKTPVTPKSVKSKANLKLNVPSLTHFSAMVKKAKSHIAAGDIYQANLSLPFQTKFNADPIELYRRLCLKNPSPYAALLRNSYGWIVSSSPELLVSCINGIVSTRPIAGTRPRGNTKHEDSRRKGQLLLSPKERAEHVMLVDLERNDVGRVSQAGSVKVKDKFSIETYSHVMHIVSQVEGKLEKNKTSLDALKALFPGGTITGCPKIRSIEIIQQLEKKERGPFYGSAGYFSQNGDAVFNILIRTALVKNKKITIRAGAGIVADSNSVREYREVWAKAQALVEAIKDVKS